MWRCSGTVFQKNIVEITYKYTYVFVDLFIRESRDSSIFFTDVFVILYIQ